jgi:hypothetical protein
VESVSPNTETEVLIDGQHDLCASMVACDQMNIRLSAGWFCAFRLPVVCWEEIAGDGI